MKLTKREKALLVVFAVVATVVLYFKFIFLPVNKEIALDRVEYQNKQLVFERTKIKDIRIKAINKEIEKIDKELSDKKESIASQIRVPEIIDEIDKAAKENSISINNIRFSGEAASIKGAFKDAAKLSQPIDNIASKALNNAGSDGNINTNKLKILTMDFEFSGTYENLTEFIKYYENNSRLFIVDLINIKVSGQLCTGTLKLNAYFIPSDKPGFMYIANNTAIRTNPFK